MQLSWKNKILRWSKSDEKLTPNVASMMQKLEFVNLMQIKTILNLI